jgi:hypothetical protein
MTITIYHYIKLCLNPIRQYSILTNILFEPTTHHLPFYLNQSKTWGEFLS